MYLANQLVYMVVMVSKHQNIEMALKSISLSFSPFVMIDANTTKEKIEHENCK
jgi:phosphotransacetylase